MSGRGSGASPFQTGRGGKRHALLADVSVRIGANAGGEFVEFRRGSLPPKLGSPWPPTKARLVTSELQRPERVVALAFLATPPGRDIRDEQLLVQQTPGERRQEGEERRRLDRAGAERIGNRDVAGARRLDEAGHAEDGIRAQFQRVAPGIVHAADDHIHALQALEGFQEDAAVAHGQIVALDQLVAEIAREVGVLEIRLGIAAPA